MSTPNKSTRKNFVVMLSMLALMMGIAVPAFAHESGCTPGFWKTNAVNWGAVAWGPTGYSPSQTILSAFPGINTANLPNASDTLLDALNYQGGNGLDGATQIILRAAVAALLNAAHPLVDGFPIVFVVTHTVLYSLNVEGCPGCTFRESMLYLATLFDTENNRGCSIDQHGSPIV